MNREPNILRVAAVQDLSGFGRCSLTVALPVLSVMGVQTACLPTAVLSTHTGGFQGYTFRDLTGDMRPFFRHWAKEKLAFDALYIGYLGSPEQAAIVTEMMDVFAGDDCFVLVDPVMGDHGKLYNRFDDQMVRAIRGLCARADVIVPNLTEAAFLTGTPYREDELSPEELRALCEKLRGLGAEKVVLTGASAGKDTLGAACLENGVFTLYAPPRVPQHYDGTGDLFASVLLGGCLHGYSLEKAAALAADFTAVCVQKSLDHGTDPHHGVDFEGELWRLGKAILDQ